ncbi:hypothetical protein GN958_ATG22671 [Phytophthora infestans]|uniref:Uncharacterized protein n=1 Tax=Phytophthora infestans TaxID=4787 RepID=A0A8S9TQ58_PHYIN|nr:hypothetical protein GN958_ATG22655 [Phytophthora infestans]KAF4128112.1 hypothetical protein GN958_ATG22658 [Phytophthora infestans]KAF4128115.1 hypothetical protein GN958_ATG22661 [Phytophthora infestans]KAF4128118.1 hypothetical protein GN958_ATG22664 [Phytophthora infestans]KAF4128125.1 hypothetical protein GN958_ATG22671 [Phytophthora infestans]
MSMAEETELQDRECLFSMLLSGMNRRRSKQSDGLCGVWGLHSMPSILREYIYPRNRNAV